MDYRRTRKIPAGILRRHESVILREQHHTGRDNSSSPPLLVAAERGNRTATAKMRRAAGQLRMTLNCAVLYTT
jgi:hypothetical protein